MFLHQASEQIAAEYLRIRSRANEDPGTAGDEGEENWRELLTSWLPKQYEIVTKGRILNTLGVLSPQVDVLVLKPSYPSALLGKKTYLAGGVAAAFECKATLRARDFKQLFQNAVTIRHLLHHRGGTPYRDLHTPLVYGLLAHSHDWKNPGSDPIGNITHHIASSDVAMITQPFEMPDVICIADVATWTARKHLHLDLGPKHYAEKGAPMTVYVRHMPQAGVSAETPLHTPVGVLVADLFTRLAREDPALRSIAQYFRAAGVAGKGEGRVRKWAVSILSDAVRMRILNEENPFSNDPWDEWSRIFPF